MANNATSPAHRRMFEVPAALPLRYRADLVWKQRVVGPLRHRFRRIDPDTRPTHFDGYEVLERLEALPVSTWTYNFEPGVRHLGPMAQDFAAMFGLGSTNRMIEPLDANGVCMVAIQALSRKVRRLEAEVERLKAQSTTGQ